LDTKRSGAVVGDNGSDADGISDAGNSDEDGISDAENNDEGGAATETCAPA
jgi:hypothetical protein